MSISRNADASEHVWLITFLTNGGDNDWCGDASNIAVSVTESDLPSSFVTNTKGVNGTLQGTNAWLEVQHAIRSFKGYEQQFVSTHYKTEGSIVEGWFILTFDGISTNNLRFDMSPLQLKKELENLGTTGKLHVTRRDNFGIINAHQWNIIFLEYLGNVPLISVKSRLSCSNGSINANVHLTERVSGLLPRMNGVYFNQIELQKDDFMDKKEIQHRISNLEEGVGCHTRVASWNGVGNLYGPSQHAIPAIIFPTDSPSPPTNVLVTPLSDTEVKVSWQPSLNLGGVSLNSYKVEWGYTLWSV